MSDAAQQADDDGDSRAEVCAEKILSIAPLVIDAAPDAVVMVDAAGNIVLVNRQTERVFGYGRDELIGRRVEMLLPARYAKMHVQHRTEFFQHPAVRPMGVLQQELTARRKDGSEFAVDISLSPIETNDGRLVISTIRDVSAQRKVERELRASEDRTRRILDSLSSFVALLSPDGVLLDCNEAPLRAVGMRRDEVIGRAFAEGPWFSAENAEKIRRLIARTRAGEMPRDDVEVRISPEISIEVESVWSPLLDAAGRVVEIVASGVDVTGRKRGEAALRASEQRMREIMNSIGAFVGLFTPDGRIIEVNQLAAASIARTREEMIGESFFNQPWWGGSVEIEASVRDMFRRAAAGEMVREELPALLADGRWIMTDSIFMPIRDPEGEVVQIVGSGIDVTERRNSAERLQALSAWQRAILDNAAYSIIATTPEGVIQTFNAAATQMLGYAPEEMIGRVTPEIFHDRGEIQERARVFSAELGREIAPGFEVFVVRARQNLPNEYEWTFVRKDGSRFPVSLSVTALRDATGAITGFLGIARDITGKRQLEEDFRQMQKMEAVGQLSAGIAHDFNNILTVIQGQLGLLRGGASSPAETAGALDEIKDAADRASNLTRQLLTFSRRQAMRPVHLELNEVVTNMTRMLQRILGEHILMELHLSPHKPVVSADAGMLEQVLLNLVVNSRDAMPQGGRLVIETSVVEFRSTAKAAMPQARAGNFVCLSAIDTGTGISPAVLPRVFDPFFTTKEQGRGTGLGLATVYGIVQQHEGWIVVESEPGHGATFRIYLPRVLAGASPASSIRNTIETCGGNETILFVEDEPALRSMCGKFFARLGYVAHMAASGPQALEIWREHRGDIRLLVTDVVMPEGMSGFELGARLARESPGLRIIYTSGYSPEIAGRSETLVSGVNFLAKPYEMDELMRVIRAALDRTVR